MAVARVAVAIAAARAHVQAAERALRREQRTAQLLEVECTARFLCPVPQRLLAELLVTVEIGVLFR